MRQTRKTIPVGELVHRLDWSQRGELRAALRRHAIVHLEAPRLSTRELLEVATGLGTVFPDRREEFRIDGAPEIMAMGNVRNDRGEVVAGDASDLGFHSDRSYQSHPPELTLLYALEVPTRGGATEFSSLYRLYDECDAATRAAWSELEVEHETNTNRFDGLSDRSTVHPLVRRHPDTGRRLVFASPPYTRRIRGLTEAEGEEILRRIRESLEPPDHVHHWRPHDVLLWDNRAVVHRATKYDRRESRHLWRISIFLEPPERGPRA